MTSKLKIVSVIVAPIVAIAVLLGVYSAMTSDRRGTYSSQNGSAQEKFQEGMMSARMQIGQNGYYAIEGLKKDAAGVWSATATQFGFGKRVQVQIDENGRFSSESVAEPVRP